MAPVSQVQLRSLTLASFYHLRHQVTQHTMLVAIFSLVASCHGCTASTRLYATNNLRKATDFFTPKVFLLKMKYILSTFN